MIRPLAVALLLSCLAEATWAQNQATPGGPHLELDNASYPANAADAANSARLRDGARTLLAETLDKTLPAILAP
jgi:hypothetical protein